MVKNQKVLIAVGLVWLFHISALIGIELGNLNWFIEKTPLNLCLCLILFIISYPLIKQKQWFAFSLFFVGGMFAEWLGVHFSLLFGTYEYGSNFGPKIDGIPLLIGSYWGILPFITASVVDYTQLSNTAKVVLGALLMVVLDFFMEHSSAAFDFWEFEGDSAPLQNYMSWFIIALLFHGLLRILKISGNKSFSLNLYLAQLIFFIYFFLR